MRDGRWLWVFAAICLVSRLCYAQADGSVARADGGASCTTSNDCAPPTPYCDVPSHSCRQCLSDTNCAGRGVCDSIGRCAECRTDAECPNFLPYCDATLGACVECRSDKNCGASVKCAAGTCGTCGDGYCSPFESLYGCYTDCDCYYCGDGGYYGTGGYYEGGLDAGWYGGGNYPSYGYCGDGIVEYGEDCDGNDLGPYGTCAAATLGQLTSGVLLCSTSCTYLTFLCQQPPGIAGATGMGGGPAGFGGYGGTTGGAHHVDLDAGPSVGECVPGQQVRCPCPRGNDGVQVCASSGRSFGACECATSSSAIADAGPRRGKTTTTTTQGGCGCQLGSAKSGWSPLLWVSVAVLAARRRAARRASNERLGAHLEVS